MKMFKLHVSQHLREIENSAWQFIPGSLENGRNYQ